jgi:anti-sigma factor RsiW
MTCNEADILIHAVVDDELAHADGVAAHLENCQRCAALLHAYRELRQVMAAAQLRFVAPAHLRSRIEDAVESVPVHASNRRAMLRGFAAGAAATGAIAAILVISVIRIDHDHRVLGDVMSAHLRSLQADHLIDIRTSDQHAVKPWFNGRLDVAPPVVDLTAHGFMLVGGRLDYIAGKSVPAIVYRRRAHVINLFVWRGSEAERSAATVEMAQGFNVRHWAAQGLDFWAVSDLACDELREFADKFEAARSGGA